MTISNPNIYRASTSVTRGPVVGLISPFAAVFITARPMTFIGTAAGINRPLDNGRGSLRSDLRQIPRYGVLGKGAGHDGRWNRSDFHHSLELSLSNYKALSPWATKLSELLHVVNEQLFNHFVVNYKLDQCSKQLTFGSLKSTVSWSEVAS